MNFLDRRRMHFPMAMLAILILSPATVENSQEKKSLLQECISQELVDPWQIKVTGKKRIKKTSQKK